MRIGSAIFLIAVGAIIAFAVPASLIPQVDLTMIGYILLALGVIGLIVSLWMARPKSVSHVSESRSVVDENTGETITRNESKNAGGVNPTL